MRLIMLWLLLVSVPLVADAQWDQVVPLTNEPECHFTYPKLCVDSLFRLHLIYRHWCPGGVPRPHVSLFYRRFNSWGTPLTEAMPLLSDTAWGDAQPGVLLDRNGQLHVVWNSWNNDADPRHLALYYARMNLHGEFLTPPTEILQPDTNYYVVTGIDMVQRQNGEVWVAYGDYFFVMSEDGQLITAPTLFLDHEGEIGRAFLQASPDDHVWLCWRYFTEPAQNISVMRADTGARVPETVVPNDDPFMQMSPEGFFIDSSGAFHYILYTDAAGLYYERDPRDGNPVDTIPIDPSPAGASSSDFTLVGGDTLEYLWDDSSPAVGIWRVAFALTGQLLLPPIFFTPPGFEMASNQLQWSRGSYWVPGITFDDQVAMIHVPGSEEPPNAAGRPRSDEVTPNDLQVFPQPSGGTIAFMVPPGRQNQAAEVTIYNTLGQVVHAVRLPLDGRGLGSLRLPPALAAGRYYISVRAGSKVLTSPLIYIP